MTVNRERLLRAQELRSGDALVGNANPLPVTMSGSAATDLRGLSADKPDADTVTVGTTYWSVDRLGETDEVTVSDGTAWQNV